MFARWSMLVTALIAIAVVASIAVYSAMETSRRENAEVLFSALFDQALAKHAAAQTSNDAAAVIREGPATTADQVRTALNLAQTAGRKAILNLSLGEAIQVLSLRARFPSETLRAMTVEDVVKDRLTRWMTSATGAKSIAVSGDVATAVLVEQTVVEMQYPCRGHFVREADGWKFDWWRFNLDYDSAVGYSTEAKWIAAVESVVFREVGAYPSTELWEGPGSAADLAALTKAPK